MSFLDSKNVSNMLFTFRWLLINFKREFSFESVKVLWEVFSISTNILRYAQ